MVLYAYGPDLYDRPAGKNAMPLCGAATEIWLLRLRGDVLFSAFLLQRKNTKPPTSRSAIEETSS
jgi:hypothetical protein